MNIILTIKSFLNYLYNNLIDLIWVKKIKFQDGTELDTVPKVDSFNLFDIKRTSERIAQKGWSCISYPTQNKLNKADVPTAYSALEEKYENVDGALSEITPMTNYTPQVCIDGYYYFTKSDGIYRSRYIDLSNEEFFYMPAEFYYAATQLFSVSFNSGTCLLSLTNGGYNGYTWFFSLIDTNKNLIKSTELYSGNYIDDSLKDRFSHNDEHKATMLNNVGYILSSANGWFAIVSVQEDGTCAFTLNFNKDRTGETVNDFFFKGFTRFNPATGNNNFYGNIRTICAYDNKLYFGTASIVFWYNPTDGTYDYNDTTLLTGYTITRYGEYVDYSSKMFVYNGKLSILNTIGVGTVITLYQMDNNGNWTSVGGITLLAPIYVGTISPNEQGGNAFRAFAVDNDNNYYFVFVDKANNQKKVLYKTTNFRNNNLIDIYTFNGDIFSLIINNNDFAYVCNYTYTYLYSGYTLTVYTDTINGIDIKYYKNGDWKICTPDIAVGNDANLQAVYEYLGYLNYWWIDKNNEQISLQRNSNFLTFMYVGDDYEDSELPSKNTTRLLPQKNYVEDITSTTITFDEDNFIWPNTDYIFGTLTSLEFDTDSYVQNQLETTIKFTAGSNFSFTDNSSIVWVDSTPIFTQGNTYLILIFNNLAFIKEW